MNVLHWDARQAFSAIGSVANELIDQIDRERIREVRARVDRKILEQSLRGQFQIDSSPGTGTRVRAVFPLSQGGV